MVSSITTVVAPMSNLTIHPTATVEEGAKIGAGTKIWHYAHVRAGATVGEDCVIGKSVFLDSEAVLGRRVKIQNFVSVYSGVTIQDEVLVGPSVTFTNDLFPRVRDGDENWTVVPTVIEQGVGLGANCTIVCGNRIGKYSLIGAGAVIVRDVAPYALMVGNPARQIGWVDESGQVVARI